MLITPTSYNLFLFCRQEQTFETEELKKEELAEKAHT